VNAFTNWCTNQLATYGWGPILAVLAAATAAFAHGLAAAIDWIDDQHQARLELRNGIRAAERHANHPANRQHRKEKP
jgi:hypothetical protein